MSMERVTFIISPATLDKAHRLCRQLNVHNLSELFDQMVEELDWQCNYSKPVRAALLADRAISKAANSSDSQGNSSRSGEQPA